MTSRKVFSGVISAALLAACSGAASANSIQLDATGKSSLDTAQITFTSLPGQLEITVANTSVLTNGQPGDAIGQVSFTLGGGYSISGAKGGGSLENVATTWTLATTDTSATGGIATPDSHQPGRSIIPLIICQLNPVLPAAATGSFCLGVPGLTSTTDLTNIICSVSVGFGARLNFSVASPAVPSVPLPAAVWMGYGTLLGVGALALIRRRRRLHEQHL